MATLLEMKNNLKELNKVLKKFKRERSVAIRDQKVLTANRKDIDGDIKKQIKIIAQQEKFIKIKRK